MSGASHTKEHSSFLPKLTPISPWQKSLKSEFAGESAWATVMPECSTSKGKADIQCAGHLLRASIPIAAFLGVPFVRYERSGNQGRRQPHSDHARGFQMVSGLE